MEKQFTKNDNGFVCAVCGKTVKPLITSSRDHCNHCLCSLHVDIFPGDRLNECKGVLKPVEIEYNSNKGYVVVYKCNKCKQMHKNKTAHDDDMDTILSVMNGYYKY